jgi:Sensors of blue-light using FAD
MPEPSPPVLLRLMYASVSAGPLTHGQLYAVFEQALRNNARDGITGVLLADGRLNVHYIEGAEAVVLALWARIQADPRHHSIVLLHQALGATKRLFPQHALLRGQASRAEILSLVRSAYQLTEGATRPAWAHAIAPLIILLDGEFGHAYAGVARHAEYEL